MAARAKVRRKWQSPIWDYVDALVEKSKGLVKGDEKICEMFKGKNPMNLKEHLKRKAYPAHLEKINENTEPPSPETALSGGRMDNQRAEDKQPALLQAFNLCDNQW